MGPHCKRRRSFLGDLFRYRADPNVFLAHSDWNATRRVHSLHDEWHLFRKYDPVTDAQQYFWARTILTVAKRVKIDTEHRDGCRGWADDGGGGFSVSRLGRVCSCPSKVGLTGYEWRIDPPLPVDSRVNGQRIAKQ